MSDIDKYFRKEIKAIASDSKTIASQAGEELRREIQLEIRRNFNNPSAAFVNGVKVHEFENATYVRLSPLLSGHAENKVISGDPSLWILLPDGNRLGFRRMGNRGYSWDALKRRYGQSLAIVPINGGHVVLYRYHGKVVPIYKIQAQVQAKQRIDFFRAAEKIASKYGFKNEN